MLQNSKGGEKEEKEDQLGQKGDSRYDLLDPERAAEKTPRARTQNIEWIYQSIAQVPAVIQNSSNTCLNATFGLRSFAVKGSLVKGSVGLFLRCSSKVALS
jgi:hypothetical protein